MKIIEDKINGVFEGFTPFQIKCRKGFVELWQKKEKEFEIEVEKRLK